MNDGTPQDRTFIDSLCSLDSLQLDNANFHMFKKSQVIIDLLRYMSTIHSCGINHPFFETLTLT